MSFANCQGCIFKTATCGTRGPVDSPFVIVGESPGKNEIKEGKPFVGESGKMLDACIANAFKAIGKEPIAPYLTNAIACFPQGKDQAKLEKAAVSCHSRLEAQCRKHPRKVILALGNAAAWSLVDDYDIKVTQVRGTIFNDASLQTMSEHGIVVTVHPAYLMRGTGSYPKFKKDIRTALMLLCDVPLPRYIMSTHTVWQTEEEIDAYHNSLPDGCELGVDIETSGFSHLDDDILCIGVGREDIPDKSFIIPEALVPAPATKRLLEDRRYGYIWHNGKFDIRFLRSLGDKPGSNVESINAVVDEDTMLLSYVLDENGGIHDLEQVSQDAVNAPNWKAMLDQYRSSKKASYREIPVPILHKYLGLDIGATTQSHAVLKPQVMADKHSAKLYKHLIRWANFLVEVERNGMFVDKEHVAKLSARFMVEITERKERLNVVARGRLGKEINPNAPLQVAELLYDGVKIPKYKGSRSTDADTLDMLPLNPVVTMVKEYRKSQKIYSTYVKPLYNFDPLSKKTNSSPKGGSVEGTRGKHLHTDGHIHCVYKLHATVTGRLGSSEINMQNIPRDPEIRSQFVAKSGRRLVEFDYNQAELRCLAELSRCPDLCAIYLDPTHLGLHHELAMTLFGEGYDDDDKMRAKMVNFGIVYGRTGASLAEEWKVSLDEGNRWVQGWFKRFPVAKTFIDSCREAPLANRTLITPFGRKRRFGVVSWENKNAVQNEAANFPHQSIASDCNLEAAERCWSSFSRDYDAHPCNLVHDSNIWDLPDNDEVVRGFGARVIEVMQQVPKEYGLTYIPFVADGKMGKRWGHLEKVKKSFWYPEQLAA